MKNDKKETHAMFYPASKELTLKAPLINKSLIYALKDADQMLQEKQAYYINWVEADINSLGRAYQSLASAVNLDEDHDPHKNDVYKLSYNMKSQGGTFKYPLVTYVMDNLCKFLDVTETIDDHGLRVVELHISAVTQVVTHKLSGKGGKMGLEVIRGLTKVVEQEAPKED